MAFTEDISAFLRTDEFAVTATIGAALVPGIFYNGYQTGLAGTMETTGPTFMGATADLSAAVEGTSLVINSVTYKVVDNQPDGTGMTALVLERAA